MAEVSIRYVHEDEDSGVRPMLGLRGKSQAHCVGVEYDRIYSLSIPVQYFDRASLVLKHNDPYPIHNYLRMMEEKANRPGSKVSPKAKEILRFAHDPDNFDEDQIINLADQPESGDFEAPAAPSEKPAKSKKPAPRASVAGKPPKSPVITSTAAGKPEKRGRGRPPGTAGSGLIARLAGELKCDPAHLRKACRSAGLRAPYEAEKDIRSAWKKHGKS